jgi:hypothetical protein
MIKITLLSALTALLILPSLASAATTAELDATTNATWVRVLTLARIADGESSWGQQTMTMNITALPEGGAKRRTLKSLANPNNYYYQPSPWTTLVIGENNVSIPGGVSFDRAVKVQFDSDDIEFDALTINGVNAMPGTPTTPDPAEGTQGVGQPFSNYSNIFAVGNNSSWPAVATLALSNEGAATQGEQTLEVNITYIPEGGAQYRIYRTLGTAQANGNPQNDTGNGQDLTLGVNTITVPAVTFTGDIESRTVKAQFSGNDIEFDALSINGVDLLVGEGTQGDGNPVSDYQSIFAATSASATTQGWLRVATLTTTSEGVAVSGMEQTLVINLTYIPSGGANYRIYKTLDPANGGGGDFSSSQALVFGVNTITIPAVSFNRGVKIQLDNTDIEFDALTINGEDMLDDSGDKVTIANSKLFNAGPDANWVAVLTTAVSQDGASSQNAQTVVMNVTTLPAGANYRVVKTVSNGTWYAADSQALSLGPNTITVNSVAFDRNVKIQFSSDAVEYNSLSVNGTARVIGASVSAAPSVSIDGSTLTWTETDGTTLQFSDDLESWTSLPSATSPYSPSTSPDRFYRTISEEE